MTPLTFRRTIDANPGLTPLISRQAAIINSQTASAPSWVPLSPNHSASFSSPASYTSETRSVTRQYTWATTARAMLTSRFFTATVSSPFAETTLPCPDVANKSTARCRHLSQTTHFQINSAYHRPPDRSETPQRPEYGPTVPSAPKRSGQWCGCRTRFVSRPLNWHFP